MNLNVLKVVTCLQKLGGYVKASEKLIIACFSSQKPLLVRRLDLTTLNMNVGVSLLNGLF